MSAVKISKVTQQSETQNDSRRDLTVSWTRRSGAMWSASMNTVAALRGSASKFCTETVCESTTGAEPLKRAFVLTSSWTTVCIMWLVNRHATYSTGVGGVEVWAGRRRPHRTLRPPPPLSLTSPHLTSPHLTWSHLTSTPSHTCHCSPTFYAEFLLHVHFWQQVDCGSVTSPWQRGVFTSHVGTS